MRSRATRSAESAFSSARRGRLPAFRLNRLSSLCAKEDGSRDRTSRPRIVRAAADFEGVLPVLTRQKVDAVMVVEDPMIQSQSLRVVKAALREKVPAVFSLPNYVAAGGLMSYAPNRADLWRRAARLTDKILRGEKPGDLPVEQPSTFELAINLKTAKALGLTIPQSLLLRADEVIQ